MHGSVAGIMRRRCNSFPRGIALPGRMSLFSLLFSLRGSFVFIIQQGRNGGWGKEFFWGVSQFDRLRETQ